MREGFQLFTREDLKGKIVLKGEWKLNSDSFASWLEYLYERELNDDENEIIDTLRDLKYKRKSEKKIFRIVKDYSTLKSKETL